MLSTHTILFDFDYTLADSTPGILDSLTYALQVMGLPIPRPHVMRATIGKSMTATLRDLAGEGATPRVDEFVAHFTKRADEIMVDQTVMLPFATRLISSLKAYGYKLGIVSSKRRKTIAAVLERERLQAFFNAVVGWEDVYQHKPAPDSLYEALRQLSTTRQKTLFVGDSLADAVAAQAANIPFAPVLTGTTRREAFISFPYVAILNSAHGVLHLLSSSLVEAAPYVPGVPRVLEKRSTAGQVISS